jgi:hypothetical protein
MQQKYESSKQQSNKLKIKNSYRQVIKYKQNRNVQLLLHAALTQFK